VVVGVEWESGGRDTSFELITEGGGGAGETGGGCGFCAAGFKRRRLGNFVRFGFLG
jgi:hypothetical protein